VHDEYSDWLILAELFTYRSYIPSRWNSFSVPADHIPAGAFFETVVTVSRRREQTEASGPSPDKLTYNLVP